MRPSPSPSRRILRGYGPLVAFALVFLLMALFFPTVGRKVVTVNGEGAAAGPGSEEVDNGGSAGAAGAAGQAARQERTAQQVAPAWRAG